MDARLDFNENTIEVTFIRPILAVGWAPTDFTVNSQAPIALSYGASNNSLILEYSETFLTQAQTSKYELVFKPISPRYYLDGPANSRIIPEFNLSVFVTNPKTSLPNRSPLVDEFVETYGVREAVMLTNPDQANATEYDSNLILKAIQDGEALYDNYHNAASQGQALVYDAGRRRTVMIFARYFLDTRCRRKHVTEDYERAIEELKYRGTENITIQGTYSAMEDLEYRGTAIDLCSCVLGG